MAQPSTRLSLGPDERGPTVFDAPLSTRSMILCYPPDSPVDILAQPSTRLSLGGEPTNIVSYEGKRSTAQSGDLVAPPTLSFAGALHGPSCADHGADKREPRLFGAALSNTRGMTVCHSLAVGESPSQPSMNPSPNGQQLLPGGGKAFLTHATGPGLFQDTQSCVQLPGQKETNKQGTEVGEGSRTKGAKRGAKAPVGLHYNKTSKAWEANVWDPDLTNSKQVYLGMFRTQEEAKIAHDRFAIKLGLHDGENPHALHFPIEDYEEEIKKYKSWSDNDYLWKLRKSSGNLTSAMSGLRGVRTKIKDNKPHKFAATIHHTVPNIRELNMQVDLGTFSDKIEAAKAYDMAVLCLRPHKPWTNFRPGSYSKEEIYKFKRKLFEKMISKPKRSKRRPA